MADPGATRHVHRLGELADDPQHQIGVGRGVVPHRDVERLGRDILLRPIRDGPFDARGDRLDDRRMKEVGFRGERELIRQRLRLLRRDVETKHLDRDQAVARRLVRAEHRAQRAHADLVQDPEGSERRRRSE